MTALHKYRVIVEWPSGRQYSASVKSDLELEELQREYADKVEQREPILFDQGAEGERATILPFEGIMLILMPEKAFEIAQNKARARAAEAQREQIQRLAPGVRGGSGLPIFMPK